MADINDLIRSKKVKEFVRKEKSRPWTVSPTQETRNKPVTEGPETRNEPLKVAISQHIDSISPAEQNLDVSNALAKHEQSVRSKVVTKYQQTGDKVESNLSQSEAKVEPNLSQSSEKPESKLSQQKVKLEPEPEPHLEPNLSQSEAKVEPKAHLGALVGLQKNVLYFIYDSCRFSGSKITSPLAIENIALSTKTTVSAARKAVQRIEEKGFIVRKEFKNGRSGWTKYELPDPIYQELTFSQSEAKVEPNLSQTRAKLRTELEPEPEPTLSSSSSDLYISNKTTTQSSNDRLAWIEGINLDSVQSVGITKSTLLRCCELYPTITPETLEDLVYRFAEFMKSPKNKVQNARGFFIGLAKQLSEGITPLDHIETSNERLMREYAEKLREKKERQEQFEREAMEFAFADWINGLSLENKAQLVPESQFAKFGSPGHDAMLKKHFCDNVWPEKREQIQRGEL
jgi:predicted transcriptional regulator